MLYHYRLTFNKTHFVIFINLRFGDVILRMVLGPKKRTIRKYRNMIRDACDILDENIERPIGTILDKTAVTKYISLWYVLVRRYKPEVVVETGVSMGWSTSMILYALNRNKKGRLYSIDTDSDQTTKDWGGVGYLLTQELKSRWDLIIGDSKETLKPLLDRLGTVDMFIHDSDHSYDVMKFEYETAWKYLRSGGILASDDVNQSQAWQEFLETYKSEIVEVKTFLEKPRETDKQFGRPLFSFCTKA